MRALLVALPLMLLPAPAMAQDAPTTSATSATAGSKVKCRRLEVTGSLVRKAKSCKTIDEWNRISDEQQRDADDLISRSRSGMNPNG